MCYNEMMDISKPPVEPDTIFTTDEAFIEAVAAFPRRFSDTSHRLAQELLAKQCQLEAVTENN